MAIISGKISYLNVSWLMLISTDIFDFTNTDKYYEPESMESLGVRHHKFKIKGHHVPE